MKKYRIFTIINVIISGAMLQFFLVFIGISEKLETVPFFKQVMLELVVGCGLCSVLNFVLMRIIRSFSPTFFLSMEYQIVAKEKS